MKTCQASTDDLMKIYTRTGDDGSTGLFGGGRVEKRHPRIRAYGTVDEINSVIGLALAHFPTSSAFGPLRERLVAVQNDLFIIGADLATPFDSKASVPRIGEEHVAVLEQSIDEMDAQLPELSRFILPGGHEAAATLHVARTTCRRAEREVVDAMHVESLNSSTVKYLNRLSDFLFVAARLVNRLADIPDVTWSG